jgi:hypothetical protein
MSSEKLLKINECIICLESIESDITESKLFNNCDHVNNYHTECANNWIKECNNNNKIPTCPLCRKYIGVIIINTQTNEELFEEYENINQIPLRIYIAVSTIFVIGFFISNSL